MIYLSGEGLTLELTGKNLKVQSRLALNRKDLSGESSDTEFSEAGNKAQEFSVSLQIPKSDDTPLKQIYSLAIATDSAGSAVIYDIVNDLATALGITQVYFAGDLVAKENGTLLCYDVTFVLKEYNSTSERSEDKKSVAVVATTSEGEVAITGDTSAMNEQISSLTT